VQQLVEVGRGQLVDDLERLEQHDLESI
jgi:hypothetical protein